VVEPNYSAVEFDRRKISPVAAVYTTQSATSVITCPAGLPFTADATGIDKSAFKLGLGLFYDIDDYTRFGFNYRLDARMNSQASQTIGIGIFCRKINV
jgi:long-subunit fatty acid transport protein